MIVFIGFGCYFFFKGSFKNSPCQIFGNENKKVMILFKLCKDIIYNKMNLVIKICKVCLKKCFMCIVKKLSGFVRDQFVADIIFIFKIKIEGTFRNTSAFYDI